MATEIKRLDKETVIRLCDLGYPTTVWFRTTIESSGPFGGSYEMQGVRPGRNEDEIIYLNNVVDWLREEKKIHVIAFPAYGDNKWTYEYFRQNKWCTESGLKFDGYELALSAAIIKAIEICECENKKDIFSNPDLGEPYNNNTEKI